LPLERVGLAAFEEAPRGNRLPVAGVEDRLPLDARLVVREHEGQRQVVGVQEDEEGVVPHRQPLAVRLLDELTDAWAGAIDEVPPDGLDAIVDTTPVWGPDLEALNRLKPGGRLVINAIRKEEVDKEVLLQLDYASQLWMEKEIKSVANVTRRDVREFLALAAEADIKPEYQEYDLEDANMALLEMKQGKIRGAKVLRVS